NHEDITYFSFPNIENGEGEYEEHPPRYEMLVQDGAVDWNDNSEDESSENGLLYEMLVQGSAVDWNSDDDNSEDEDSEDEYEEFPPRYEKRNWDILLDTGVPLYSEFSWMRAMLCGAQFLV